MNNTKKPRNEQTSARVATAASAVLRSSTATAQQKSAAASALTQARNHTGSKKK